MQHELKKDWIKGRISPKCAIIRLDLMGTRSQVNTIMYFQVSAFISFQSLSLWFWTQYLRVIGSPFTTTILEQHLWNEMFYTKREYTQRWWDPRLKSMQGTKFNLNNKVNVRKAWWNQIWDTKHMPLGVIVVVQQVRSKGLYVLYCLVL